MRAEILKGIPNLYVGVAQIICTPKRYVLQLFLISDLQQPPWDRINWPLYCRWVSICVLMNSQDENPGCCREVAVKVGVRLYF